ncbi:MAG: hypothetical protein Q8O19_04705 [Rectinemataceae bacterium]|nr:hypothetical protein [Rectinemataceae bacterium]
MDSEPKPTRGRPSQKRDALFRLYSLLRCAMYDDDLAELQRQHREFRDMTAENKDTDIQKAIDQMVEAMCKVQVPDITKAMSLRGV